MPQMQTQPQTFQQAAPAAPKQVKNQAPTPASAPSFNQAPTQQDAKVSITAPTTQSYGYPSVPESLVNKAPPTSNLDPRVQDSIECCHFALSALKVSLLSSYIMLYFFFF